MAARAVVSALAIVFSVADMFGTVGRYERDS